MAAENHSEPHGPHMGCCCSTLELPNGVTVQWKADSRLLPAQAKALG